MDKWLYIRSSKMFDVVFSVIKPKIENPIVRHQSSLRYQPMSLISIADANMEKQQKETKGTYV